MALREPFLYDPANRTPSVDRDMPVGSQPQRARVVAGSPGGLTPTRTTRERPVNRPGIRP